MYFMSECMKIQVALVDFMKESKEDMREAMTGCG